MPQDPRPAERIVSLLPSATEIVCALGLEERLVGVTHECDYPPSVRDKPKVTVTHIPTDATSAEIDGLVHQQLSNQEALYSLDTAVLRDLRPDLIVTQTLCDVCAVDDFEVKQALKKFDAPPKVLYLEPTRLDGVLENILQVGRAAGAANEARSVVLGLRQRIERVRATAREPAGDSSGHDPTGRIRVAARAGRGDAGDALPKVVVLEWLDPLFSCGHWTPELVAIAGGVEPLARPGERSREIKPDELASADPDLILIACCGFGVERTLEEVPSFLKQPQIVQLRCVRDENVFVTDGSAYFSRPGPRLVDSLELLAHTIHPRRSPLPAGVPAAVRAP